MPGEERLPARGDELGIDHIDLVGVTVAVLLHGHGNGRNDVAMLRVAVIGVAILAGEGIAIDALQAADVLATGPVDAIDLVLKPKRLIATLRG